MKRETKIIAKWILYTILLTAAFVLIFFALPWIAQKITGNLGIKDGVEALFVVMLVFDWALGITFGLKFCCDELVELENTERTEDESDERLENENKTSLKEETEI